MEKFDTRKETRRVKNRSPRGSANIQPIKLCPSGHVTPPRAQPGKLAVTNDGASARELTPNLPGKFGASVTARQQSIGSQELEIPVITVEFPLMSNNFDPVRYKWGWQCVCLWWRHMTSGSSPDWLDVDSLLLGCLLLNSFFLDWLIDWASWLFYMLNFF